MGKIGKGVARQATSMAVAIPAGAAGLAAGFLVMWFVTAPIYRWFFPGVNPFDAQTGHAGLWWFIGIDLPALFVFYWVGQWVKKRLLALASWM